MTRMLNYLPMLMSIRNWFLDKWTIMYIRPSTRIQSAQANQALHGDYHDDNHATNSVSISYGLFLCHIYIYIYIYIMCVHVYIYFPPNNFLIMVFPCKYKHNMHIITQPMRLHMDYNKWITPRKYKIRMTLMIFKKMVTSPQRCVLALCGSLTQ